MSPLFYLVIGLVGGGLIVAVVFLLSRRGQQGSAAEMAKRLETIDRSLRDEFSRNREEAGAAAKNQREELTRSLESVRSIVDVRLRQLQDDNANQIDKMRATVDEKLQGTLEKRLGESFKLVSDRLEQVHQGLGAMQQLASDVGGLQRVLTNVKTRGGWSEWQLGVLLDEMLTPEQFAKNMKMREDTDERVEFAIKLPGDENGAPVWLPIDAKFPMEHYDRLAAAQEKLALLPDRPVGIGISTSMLLFTAGLSVAYYPGAHIGYYGEASFVGLSLDDACSGIYFAGGSGSAHDLLCQAVAGSSTTLGAVSFIGGITVRGAPGSGVSPYVVLGGGLLLFSRSTLDMSGEVVTGGGVQDISIVVDNSPHRNSPLLAVGAGLRMRAGQGYGVRVAFEDLIARFHRLTGPVNAIGQGPVASKFDYFHYEIVNGLAEGDESRLGASYPGSKV